MEYKIYSVEKSPYSGIVYPTPKETIVLLAPDGLAYASGNEDHDRPFFYLLGEADSCPILQTPPTHTAKRVYTPLDGLDIYVTGIHTGKEEVTFRAYILRGPSKFSYVKYALETPLTVYYEVDTGGPTPTYWKKEEYVDEVTPAVMKRELKSLWEAKIGNIFPKDFSKKFKKMKR